MNRPPNLVAIRTVQQAVALSDDWQRAYRVLRQDAEREIRELEWKLLMAQTDLTLERAERALEKWGEI